MCRVAISFLAKKQPTVYVKTMLLMFYFFILIIINNVLNRFSNM